MKTANSRYEIYTPVNKESWVLLCTAASVSKEKGAISKLEDVVKTGPDTCVAIVYDTEKNRHVRMFRVNVGNRTLIKPVSGGWREGDADVRANTVSAKIDLVAAGITFAEKAPQEEPKEEPKETPAQDYEGQPDYALVNWIEEEYRSTFYLIPKPTERQMKVLNTVHGCFINGENTQRQDAALSRVFCALAEKDEYCRSIVDEDQRLSKWVGIWRGFKVEDVQPLRLEMKTVEIFTCGFIS